MHDDPTLQAWSLLVGAHDRVMKELAAELKRDFALTVAQYDVLLRLVRVDDHRLTMAHLAHELLSSSGAATKVVDRLVDRELVRRNPGASDRRVVWVELTATGLDLILRARRAHHVSIAAQTVPFADEAEAQHVIAFLGRLNAGRDGS